MPFASMFVFMIGYGYPTASLPKLSTGGLKMHICDDTVLVMLVKFYHIMYSHSISSLIILG